MDKIVIGLTGPTGAGKSTVAAAFEKAGCKIIDADVIARQAVTNADCIASLKAEYGDDIVGEDGSLNRRLLAQRAFSNPRSAARLNEITHPIIINQIIQQITFYQQSGEKVIVLDAALLFESGADSLCTTTVAVTAPVEVRLSRIMNRDSISLELAKARIGAQQENFYYHERAQYFFDGSTDSNNIQTEANRLLKKIIGDANESI
ncbi:MAG: dephospho-CoA kinase [Caproiciproducens sp.]|nr:dephospho-CoA kinase [Caproiciproducens sp.]